MGALRPRRGRAIRSYGLCQAIPLLSLTRATLSPHPRFLACFFCSFIGICRAPLGAFRPFFGTDQLGPRPGGLFAGLCGLALALGYLYFFFGLPVTGVEL